MKIALIQQEATANIDDNLGRGLAAARNAAQEGAQVICFAELAFEPFYPRVQAVEQTWGAEARALGQPIPGPITEAFQQLAAEYGVVVILNLYERDGQRSFDTSPVIDADGSLLGLTRMVHITDYEGFHEQGYYDPGDCGAPVYKTRFGTLGVAICYDRHFPEYTRALALAGAQVIVVPQAGVHGEWPAGLYEAEMRVIAFQNGVFTALCNRVGQEGSLAFSGESFICDPSGQVVARAAADLSETLHHSLDLSWVAQSTARKLFFRDRRPELYGSWLGGDPPTL